MTNLICEKVHILRNFLLPICNFLFSYTYTNLYLLYITNFIYILYFFVYLKLFFMYFIYHKKYILRDFAQINLF